MFKHIYRLPNRLPRLKLKLHLVLRKQVEKVVWSQNMQHELYMALILPKNLFLVFRQHLSFGATEKWFTEWVPSTIPSTNQYQTTTSYSSQSDLETTQTTDFVTQGKVEHLALVIRSIKPYLWFFERQFSQLIDVKAWPLINFTFIQQRLITPKVMFTPYQTFR